MRGRWPRSVPLRWRVFGLLSVLAGLLIVDVMLGVAHNGRLETQQRLAAQLRPIEEVPERLVIGLVDQQNSVRAFALTGDERLLEAYVQNQRVEGRAVSTLRRELRGQPTLLGLLDQVLAGATAWHRRVAEPVITATRDGRTAEATRLVATLDEPLFTALRRDAEILGTALDEQLDASQGRAAAAADRLNRELLLSSLLGLLLLVVSGALIRRWLTRPVGDLSVQLRRVTDGHLQEEIAGAGPREFRQLGHDAEVMRRRILDELEESRRAVEAMEQNAPLVASLRSELATPAVSLPAGLRIAARFEPAEGVLAGDWIEAVRLENDAAALVVVDVSGHGPEAGLRALWLKHLLIPALNLELDPADVLHWVAGQIGDTGEWFATSVIVSFDVASGRCCYANAGHPPAMVLGPDGVRRLQPTGPVFNVLPGSRWETTDITLRDDDVLVIYTDGITEARSASGEEYGEERLSACLAAAVGEDVDVIADRVMDEVHTFASARLRDDATLAIARRRRVRSAIRASAVRTTWST